MVQKDGTPELVTIKPIVKEGWLQKGHDGEIRYTNCQEWLMPVRDNLSKAFKTGLSDEEAEKIEKKLRLEPGTLSPYNDDFWANHKKAAKIGRDGLVLNVEFPEDRIKLSWLMEHPRVANSESEKNDDPDYDYVITSSVQEATVKNKKRASLKSALEKLWTLSTQEKIDVLKVLGKTISKTTSEELIDDYINSYVEDDPKTFISIVEDADFKTKVLIKEALACKAIVLEGTHYKLNGGDSIGYDLESTINYLNSPENASVKKGIVAKVKISK